MVATLCGNRNNDINKIRIFSRSGPAWRRGLGHALAEIRCDNKTTKKEGGVAEQQPGKQLTLCKPLRSSYQQKRPANAGRGSMVPLSFTSSYGSRVEFTHPGCAGTGPTPNGLISLGGSTLRSFASAADIINSVSNSATPSVPSASTRAVIVTSK